jgi:tetratricopeptide (TPR) repeat protein
MTGDRGGSSSRPYGGKGSERIAGSTTSGLTTIATEVLQSAREISMSATSVGELHALRSRVSAEQFESLTRHGLAAYLVAAPQLERKLTTQLHAPGENPCPEGVALVYAAVDWARCGRSDPIDEAVLRRVWPSYLAPRQPATDDAFASALAWALRPVAGTIALLHRAGSYQAFDYIVRLVRDKPGAEPPRDASWGAAIETAADAQALTVGVAAYGYARSDRAIEALSRARESSLDELAAIAGFNLGVVFGELGRSEEAIAVYDEFIARYGEDPEPRVREAVARALSARQNVTERPA